MPSIHENLRAWDQGFDWPMDGEPWSAAWGTSTAQWYCTLLPRTHAFLPTQTILEIAPGRGRWTQFLKGLCEKLILVDLSPRCIEACKKRFQADAHIIYHVNDGSSLDMIPDRSVDFVFSFDSLVHAEADVIQRYLEQIGRKLTERGVGFIHHSNLGDYPRLLRLLKWSKRLSLYNRFEIVTHQEHWRAYSMCAGLFRTFCSKAGLTCIRQELINWVGTRFLIDCLSTFTKEGSDPDRQCVITRNPSFMSEAKHARWLSQAYAMADRSQGEGASRRDSAPPLRLP